jgi:hypothetical protein
MIPKTALVMLTCVFLASLSIGCGADRRPAVETVNVSGTVQLNDKPLEGAQVNFIGPESKYEGGAEFDETMIGTGSDVPGANTGPKQLVPKKYSDPNDSELRFPVPDGGSTEANFNLTNN